MMGARSGRHLDPLAAGMGVGLIFWGVAEPITHFATPPVGPGGTPEAARRAIIRCGASGYNLPVEKYDQWRDIEMTFNPERMRIK